MNSVFYGHAADVTEVSISWRLISYVSLNNFVMFDVLYLHVKIPMHTNLAKLPVFTVKKLKVRLG